MVQTRVVRDVILYDEVLDTIEQSPVRQLTVASNNTSFDAFALAVDVWPDELPYNDGLDFAARSSPPSPGLCAEPGRSTRRHPYSSHSMSRPAEPTATR